MNTINFLIDITHPRISRYKDAGQILAEQLGQFAKRKDVIVLAIPTSSVSLATETAARLRCATDVLLLAHIIAPGGAGHSIGALTSDGVRVLDDGMIARLGLKAAEVNAAIQEATAVLARRRIFYQGPDHVLAVADQTVLLVDDGTTPSSTLRDAIELLRLKQAAKIVVALSTADGQAGRDLRQAADEVVVLA